MQKYSQINMGIKMESFSSRFKILILSSEFRGVHFWKNCKCLKSNCEWKKVLYVKKKFLILVKILSVGKYSSKTPKKGQIWRKMLKIFTNMSQKSNCMPQSRNFGKIQICKNMLDYIGLILLGIFWMTKEMLIWSEVCNLKNMQKHILPFPTYEQNNVDSVFQLLSGLG